MGGTNELAVSLRRDWRGWHVSQVEGKGRAFVGQGVISKVASRSKTLSLIEVCDVSGT